MTFYRIIFPLVLLSLMLMFLPSSDVYLLSFAFWWCTYSTFIWLLPTLFCVLLIFLSYSVFLLPPLHSGDIPTVPYSDFYLPSFAFCWCTYPCFLFLIRFPSLSCWNPTSYTLNPTCKSFLSQWWRTYTLVPSYWPPIHLDILSRFCRIFSNQAISKRWFRIIWSWLLSWLSQTVFVSMFWHDVDVVVFWVQWVICFVLWNDCGCSIMAVRVIQHDFINHG